MNSQDIQFRVALLRILDRSKRPMLTSKIAKMNKTNYGEVICVLNEMESAGLIEHFVHENLVTWVTTPECEQLQAKLFVERTDHENADNDGAGEIREDQASDLRDDPAVPVSESSC